MVDTKLLIHSSPKSTKSRDNYGNDEIKRMFEWNDNNPADIEAENSHLLKEFRMNNQDNAK